MGIKDQIKTTSNKTGGRKPAAKGAETKANRVAGTRKSKAASPEVPEQETTPVTDNLSTVSEQAIRSTKFIPVSEIVVEQRMTTPTKEHISQLAESIRDNGMENPITLRYGDDGKMILVAGLSRLEAHKLLNESHIEAFVYKDMPELEARLWEIDENLARRKHTPAQEAAQITERKRIYEMLHPEVKNVHSIGGKKGRGQEVPDTFRKSQIKTSGVSDRTVSRSEKRGSELGQKMLSRIAKTTLDTGEELDALVKLPKNKREAIVKRAEAGEKVSAKAEVKKIARQVREAELADKQKALPDKKFGVILADPPWKFQPWSTETGMDRAAENHYPTMSADDIASLPIGELAADDCVLYLWATAPMLVEALQVMRLWGFQPKSGVVWKKPTPGTGFVFRMQHEHLLYGTKGNVPAPAQGDQWSSVIDAPRGKHSEKPDQAYEMLEAYYPNLPKIELFARTARDGWEAWGNEAPEGGKRTDPTSPASSTDGHHDDELKDDHEEDGVDDNYRAPTPESDESPPGFVRDDGQTNATTSA